MQADRVHMRPLSTPSDIRRLREQGHPVSFLIAKGKRDLNLSREQVRRWAYGGTA